TGRTGTKASCEQVYGGAPTGNGPFRRQPEKTRGRLGEAAAGPCHPMSVQDLSGPPVALGSSIAQSVWQCVLTSPLAQPCTAPCRKSEEHHIWGVINPTGTG